MENEKIGPSNLTISVLGFVATALGAYFVRETYLKPLNQIKSGDIINNSREITSVFNGYEGFSWKLALLGSPVEQLQGFSHGLVNLVSESFSISPDFAIGFLVIGSIVAFAGLGWVGVSIYNSIHLNKRMEPREGYSTGTTNNIGGRNKR